MSSVELLFQTWFFYLTDEGVSATMGGKFAAISLGLIAAGPAILMLHTVARRFR